MMLSAHSPSPSSYSVHPPLSPAFYSVLSPLLQASSSAASSTTFTSVASRRSTSPLLLSSLPPTSMSMRAMTRSVDHLSHSFLADVTINDSNADYSTSSRLPPLAVLPRSVFAHSASSASAMSASVVMRSTASYDITAASLLQSSHGDSELPVEHEMEHERSDEPYSFHIGALDILSDVVSSTESAIDQSGDSTLNHDQRLTADETHTPTHQHAQKQAHNHHLKTKKATVDGERRVARACIHCSASKTKCDNKRPCGRCVRTKRSATCQDIPRRKRSGRGGRSKRRREVAEESDCSDDCQPEIVKNEEDDEEVVIGSPVMAMCTTPTQTEVGTHVVTYSAHTTMTTQDAYGAGYGPPMPYGAQPMQHSFDYNNNYHRPQEYSQHFWPPPHPHMHAHPHTPSFAYQHVHPPPPMHSVVVSPPQYAATAQSPQHVRTAQSAGMLSPNRAVANSPASTPRASSRVSGVSPNSPATPSSTASAAAAPLPTIAIGQLLSRLRIRLPRALHRAHGAVIDQFHQWSDLLAARTQQGLVAPVPLLKARQYVYHMLMDAMVALEDEEKQRRMAVMLAGTTGSSSSSSPPPPIFSPPLESEHDELLRLIHQEWDDHLFPQNAATAAADEGEDVAEGDAVDNADLNSNDKTTPRTLDAILQRRVVTPTFIIPLLSFPFLTAAPWMSASFSALLGYEGAALSTSTQTPLELLHRRQHADVAPLVPAFLSAITNRGEHYLHASGWVRQDGEIIQLMANVRVMYAEGTGFPVAVMAQFTRREEADESFAPILARMGNLGSTVPASAASPSSATSAASLPSGAV